MLQGAIVDAIKTYLLANPHCNFDLSDVITGPQDKLFTAQQRVSDSGQREESDDAGGVNLKVKLDIHALS